ncbi:MAG: IPT/TIG domain-containing protein [Planctomycetales bacterium]|nr:IPT/TIG domain-containing protein [Planctomycetales bacterium]
MARHSWPIVFCAVAAAVGCETYKEGKMAGIPKPFAFKGDRDRHSSHGSRPAAGAAATVPASVAPSQPAAPGMTGDPSQVPQIGSVEPASGSGAGGTALTVRGWWFLEGARVFVGGREATNVRLRSSNMLTCVTPELTGRSGPVDVVLQFPDGRIAAADGAFTVTGR